MTSPSGSSNKRQRRHLSWKDLPAFCDASASVSASTFGARRLPEIKDLWTSRFRRGGQSSSETVSIQPLLSGGGKTSSRHLRRRATSHRGRKRHRYPAVDSAASHGNDSSKKTASSRRSRRKKAAVLQLEHGSWQSKDGAYASTTFVAKSHWMPTHLWHAKRFHMESLWGWRVPVVHNNRGAKAALRLAREGKCLLQDATWSMQPIWFQVAKSSQPVLAQQLNRCIPNFDVSLLVNNVIGQGVMYQTDRFPITAIGPVSWISTDRSLVGDAQVEDGTSFLYFWGHPSIREQILQCMRNLFSETKSGVQGPIESVDGGIACLRLRGRSSIECLRDGMVSMESAELSSLIEFLRNRDSDGVLQHPGDGAVVFSIGSDSNIRRSILVSRRPCNPTLPSNYGVCGFDIFCHPDMAKKLFLRLIVQGGACPIGIAEEAHICLECEPPVAIFPRDYPDTSQGVSYWKAASPEWKVVRQYWEGGLGRIHIASEPTLKQLSWTDLVSDASEPVGDSVAVVRGAFGRPFLDALMRLRPKTPIDSAVASRRRKRRRDRSRGTLVHIPPIPSGEVLKHQELCLSLSRSLSLPAVLLCHVHITGSGTLAPGASMHSTGSPHIILGWATIGAFSPSRGAVHGIGVVGGARFLEAFAAAGRDGTAVFVRRLDGAREVGLKVRVRHDSMVCNGAIFLLL